MRPFLFTITILLAVSAELVGAVPGPAGHPFFMSPHANPIAVRDGRVFVVNTPADTLDVIDAASRKIVARIAVGIDPVSVSVRPDGREIWVANHLSDSVSVVDIDPASPTAYQVVATIQEFDPATKATRFDEPMGIAFASDTKAYVALSSENTIAVVDVASRKVTRRLRIPAQDPRAIAVRGGRLYVVPFESNNQTQLSGGYEIDGDRVTFDAHQHSIAHNNVLSIGHVTDIVKHPRVPDHDLFVFDTATDERVATVDGLGTLLYGLAVDARGNVFVAQTDARNDVNGRAGTKKHGLSELGNRAFLNRITRVRDIGNGSDKASVRFLDLEPLPPADPEPEAALATPYGIALSADERTVFATAAGSDMLVSVDAESGEVKSRVKVGAVPRGVAVNGSQVWVFGAGDNSVSLVDAFDPEKPILTETVALHDPTDPVIREGRLLFETAAASTTKTFSCASCHPDGHTDQLLWVLKTPVVTGGNQIMPRSTMPVRGLRDTAPFHWDGIPGDPYGGNNSASVYAHVPPNSDPAKPESTTRHLTDGALASTMTRVGDETVNDEGKPGLLSAAQRDALAKFLLAVPYPPAQRRPYSNKITSRAREGFDLFHLRGDPGGTPGSNLCGNCHRMPHLVSTNTPGTGMDAPTWRGAYDRFLILPQGRLNIIDFDFYRRVADAGNDERSIWRFSWGGREAFDPVWDMVLEGSTGQHGAFARQATLSRETARDTQTLDLLEALETAAREGAVVLEAEGNLSLRFDGKAYVEKANPQRTHARDALLELAAEGKFVGTFTGRAGARVGYDDPQPALWTLGPIEQQRGRQEFPILHAGARRMKISARHLRNGAGIFVDGRRVEGSVNFDPKTEVAGIELTSLPDDGMRLLQVQNPGGAFSNDFIFHVARDAGAAEALVARLIEESVEGATALAAAIARGDLTAVRRFIKNTPDAAKGARLPGKQTPLAFAALHGRKDIAAFLLEAGAKPGDRNGDGNTPLHVAAFLCREDIVDLLLSHKAPQDQRNDRRERPVDVVSGEWSEGLADFYRFVAGAASIEIDLGKIREARPKVANQLAEAKSGGG